MQPYPDSWLDEVAGFDLADQVGARETIELAFVVAVQRLPPRQTAAVLLSDVLGFGLDEVATTLSETSTATIGLLQPGRATLGRHRSAAGSPGSPGSPEPPRASSSDEQELARRFAVAYAAGDVAGVVSLLSDDAWLRMPPAQHEYHGPEAIRRFLETATRLRAQDFVLTPTRANRQPAFLCSLDGRSAGVEVLDSRADRLTAITHFLDADVHRYVAGTTRPRSDR